MPKAKPDSSAKPGGIPSLPRIHTVRKQKVMLDSELAALFGVETKVFNQAIRRNAGKFPGDFAFQLTREELTNLRSQIVTSSSSVETTPRSQTVTLKEHGGLRYLPWVFTEHGAIMAAMVLRSEHAVAMSVFVVRAFVQMRDQISSNLGVLRRLAEIDKKLLEHDSVLREVIERLSPLLNPAPEDESKKSKIGFVSRAARRAPARATPPLRSGATPPSRHDHLRAAALRHQGNR